MILINKKKNMIVHFNYAKEENIDLKSLNVNSQIKYLI